MKLGLLQCDHVLPELREIEGDFDEMFAKLFREYAPEVRLEVFDAQAGEYPSDLHACDGYLTTGSVESVYEPLPWVVRLTDFVRRLHVEHRPFVGICFGHQLIAHALGGRVSRSPRGWGVGAHEAARAEGPIPSWMNPSRNPVRLLVSHQDQIDVLPEGTHVLAGNDHCPYWMIALGETFLGIQGHPEFSPRYAEALLHTRRECIPSDVFESALPTFAQPLDRGIVVSWIVQFVRSRMENSRNPTRNIWPTS